MRRRRAAERERTTDPAGREWARRPAGADRARRRPDGDANRRRRAAWEVADSGARREERERIAVAAGTGVTDAEVEVGRR